MADRVVRGACASAMALVLAMASVEARAQMPAASQPRGQSSGASDVDAPQTVPGGQSIAAVGDQGAPADSADQAAEIVVTGTSIRGVAPVGANLVSVGRQAIESTGAVNVQQILKTVPAITGLGGAGVGQTAGNSYYAPTIHSLGSSASNSTLTLIDGHRLPLGGTNHALADPSMLPPIAIERVEVLAEGASSTYGSDAVAGVVNFITRKRYEGFQATGQYGHGDGYNTYTAGLLFGHHWEGGAVMAAYGFSRAGPLPNDYKARPFLQPNHIDEGGTNFQSFNCNLATVQPGNAGNIYLTPTGTASVANTAANAPCDNSIYGDRIGRETRHTFYAKIEQEVTDRLSLFADVDYSNRRTLQRISRGGIQARVFRTGTQANPFYVNPPGISGTAADSQTVRWSADDLLGPGAQNDFGAETWYATANLEYRLSDKFRFTALGMIGRDRTTEITTGALCTSCATLALNGTTNSNGTLNTSNPGRTDIIQQLPLTTANALDVWTVGSGNRTPAAIIAALKDSRSAQRSENVIRQARIGIDGALFALPGGDLRVALGGELLSYTLNTTVDRPTNTGPSSLANASTFFPTHRSVKSAFGEVLIPVISPQMEVPLVHKLDINVSARYDHYNDFGSTTNPKIAGSWEVFDGLKLRANWARSFVAPSLRSLGDPNAGGLYNGSQTTQLTETQQVPIASFPLVAQIPGISCANGFCQINGSFPGIRLQTGNPGLQPQRGTTWSAGFDFAPKQFLEGLRLSSTFFVNRLRGGITSPPLNAAINSSSINNLLTFYPQGLLPTDLIVVNAIGNIPIITALPTRIFYVNDFRQRNTLNLTIHGLDISASYRIPTGIGTFTPGGSVTYFLKYDQNFSGGRTFSVLGTTGFNTTFPSIRAQGRADLAWSYKSFSADFFANYVNKYKNWSSSTVLPVTTAGGAPTGGGDPVKSYLTFDLHASWQFSQGGRLGKSEIYVDVNNLLDRDPPFYNSAAGYDPYGASPLGRVVSVGFRTVF